MHCLATTASHAELVADPTTVGRPVPTVELRVEPATDEICVRGPMVMLGYWDDPAATAAMIDAAGWLHTGDLGELDDDGALRLSARRSDLILRGAENVYPAEIEACLESHPGVGEVAVVGLPDEEYGELVAAVAVPRSPSAVPDEAELTAFVRERLAYFKVPSRWFVREAPLPRTATGKVVRAAVREQCELSTDDRRHEELV
jgi:acyl-CoA synthetase (AMP-forming)/AMP-acid ligase II